MITKESVGQLIQERRRLSGLTQEDLASALSVDRSAISRIESGQQGVDTVQLAVIADAVGCSPQAFFRAEEEPFEVLCRAPEAHEDAIREHIEHLRAFVSNYEFLLEVTDDA